MDVAFEYRVAHSVFLEWSKTDRDLAIAHHMRRAEVCPGCGTRPAEWNPKKGGHRMAYVPEVRVCQGCIVREGAEEDKSFKEGRGKSIALTPNPEAKR